MRTFYTIMEVSQQPLLLMGMSVVKYHTLVGWEPVSENHILGHGHPLGDKLNYRLSPGSAFCSWDALPKAKVGPVCLRKGLTPGL